MDVSLRGTEGPALPLASWSKSFGLALSALEASTTLKQLTLRGPGLVSPNATPSPPSPASQHPESSSAASAAADAAGTVLAGALRLPSLETLHVYDIPWAAALRTATTALAAAASSTLGPTSIPSCPALGLHNLHEVTINGSFYCAEGAGEDDVLDGGAAEAWQALGRALASLPFLERLDLSYTHAMTYCDPARGAVLAAWPPMPRLQHLSLANDLSVQPPPPASASAGEGASGSTPGQAGGAAAPSSGEQLPSGGMSHDEGGDTGGRSGGGSGTDDLQQLGDWTAAAAADDDDDIDVWVGRVGAVAASTAASSGAAGPSDTGPDTDLRASQAYTWSGAGLDAALAALVEEGAYDSADEEEEADDGASLHSDGSAGLTAAAAATAEDLAAAAAAAGVPPNALVAADVPMLTVDAAHAAVELLTWLPTCTALTSLDLRRCGLEAVPLAVVHLPRLARLDLRGNPLGTLRVPGPLQQLTWLGFSLDPCYDMLYDMLAAEAGAVAAAEEMYAAEIQAPRLEELEVDSTSARALDLIREAASELPRLRRLALTNTDTASLGL